jgi:carbonic anhydrase
MNVRSIMSEARLVCREKGRPAMRRALMVFLLAATASAQVSTKESQSATTPAKALERLREGNVRFVAGKGEPRDLRAQVKAAAGGQYPYAAIVSCMDSRVPAEMVFDQGIGDMFSIRVAGNVVDTDDLGSLEYATKVTGSPLVLVMGHTSCGAVKGAIDDVELGHLTFLLEKIRPAVTAAGPGKSKDNAYVDRVAERNVRNVMKEIRDRSPILKGLLDSGKVGLAGAMYDLQTGKVTFLAD